MYVDARQPAHHLGYAPSKMVVPTCYAHALAHAHEHVSMPSKYVVQSKVCHACHKYGSIDKGMFRSLAKGMFGFSARIVPSAIQP